MANQPSTRKHYKFIDLSHQTFGRLKVSEYFETRHRKTYWKCLCSCGNETFVRANRLIQNITKSCGCWRGDSHATHGHNRNYAATKELRAWKNAKQRCFNPKSRYFPRYGGRGITMYAQWINSFAAFIKHIGPCPHPKLTLDRINNDGNYEPGNVRWATQKQQANNRHHRAKSTYKKGRYRNFITGPTPPSICNK